MGKEFEAVNTENDYVLCYEHDDGTIEKSYERHRVDDSHVLVVQHRNRDAHGNYYTTSKVIESTKVGYDRSFGNSKYESDHAERLYRAVCENYKTVRSTYHLLNLIETAKHYLESDCMAYNSAARSNLKRLICTMESVEMFYRD